MGAPNPGIVQGLTVETVYPYSEILSNERNSLWIHRTTLCWDFPGGPVVKTSLSNAGGTGSISGELRFPHDLWPKKKWNINNNKHCCNKFNKDFKSGPHQKNLKNIMKSEISQMTQHLAVGGQGGAVGRRGHSRLTGL